MQTRKRERKLPARYKPNSFRVVFAYGRLGFVPNSAVQVTANDDLFECLRDAVERETQTMDYIWRLSHPLDLWRATNLVVVVVVDSPSCSSSATTATATTTTTEVDTPSQTMPVAILLWRSINLIRFH